MLILYVSAGKFGFLADYMSMVTKVFAESGLRDLQPQRTYRRDLVGVDAGRVINDHFDADCIVVLSQC